MKRVLPRGFSRWFPVPSVAFHLAAIIFFLIGCASAPEVPPDKPPDWVLGYPVMPGYYVGVGSSNTGEFSEDRVIAENRAHVAVAGEISTYLRSELRIETTDETLRGARVELFEETTAVVEQELSGVEIVETYHHPNRGYWVLARLSEQRWESLQEQERLALRERVLTAIRGSREPATVREELERLAAAWDLLLQSQHGSVVRGELYGAEGYLADGISSRYRELVSGITVRPALDAIRADFDAVIEIVGTVTAERRSGRIPVGLGETPAAPGVTDEDGSFRLVFPRSGRVAGEQILQISVAAAQLPRLAPLPPFDSGQAAVRLTLVKPPAGLQILFGGESDRGVVEQGIRRFVANADLPVEIGESASLPADSYVVAAEVHLSDFPRVMDGAPLMSEGYLSFTVRKGDAVLDSMQTETRRDGGITREQAHGRLVTGLLRDLETNHRYSNDLRNAFMQR